MLKPGNTPWKKVLQASAPHHDSLEGLLRQPLVISAKYDPTYGTPKRGSLVLLDSVSGLAKPILAAQVVSLVSGTTYKVKWGVTVFNTGWAIKAINNVGAATTVTATSYTMANTDPVTGLVTGDNTITFSAALPANTQLIAVHSDEVPTAGLAGVVYESTLDDDFGLATEALGIRPDQVLGGNSAYVASLPGVKKLQDLLFIRAV